MKKSDFYLISCSVYRFFKSFNKCLVEVAKNQIVLASVNDNRKQKNKPEMLVLAVILLELLIGTN